MVTVDGGFDGSLVKVDCGISDCWVKVLNVFDDFSGVAVDDFDGCLIAGFVVFGG